MSGSRPKPVEKAHQKAHLAEQHLGDRLSALVDGELGHDSRERVLAHLATCARCKAEADAQRRLKNVFAEAAPPPPSASFLARLQGLPGGDGTSPPGGGLFGGDPREESAARADESSPSGLTAVPGGVFGGSGVFGSRRGGERFVLGYLPAPSRPAVPADHERGFRIHPVGRPDDGRGASRGLRFAVAAAGAVSLAAVALGSVTTALPSDATADARGSGSVVPARSAGSGAGAVTPDSQRRRATGPPAVQGSTLLGQTSVAPTSMSAPLVPGVPTPGTGQVQGSALRGLTAPVMAGVAALSPLIRPLDDTVAYPLAAWSAVPGATGSGLLSAPVPTPASPTAPAAPSTSPSSPPQTP
ncbi:zf-HC2 domain-containing protein [Streptomyces sp. MUSC 14]|uniref:zf-HC2 domain-containing protein n=1 Tax=Streptomyces sp. MUSC 14 TaxID=1354889 RepID=UPI0009A0C4F4|nr:zf-HC2 domain-containing protein [Streptomyces sp. MUSC 14]